MWINKVKNKKNLQFTGLWISKNEKQSNKENNESNRQMWSESEANKPVGLEFLLAKYLR